MMSRIFGFACVLYAVFVGTAFCRPIPLSLKQNTGYKPVQITYEPAINIYVPLSRRVDERLYKPVQERVAGSSETEFWSAPKEVRDFFTIANIIRPDSAAMQAVCEAVQGETRAVSAFLSMMYTLPRTPPFIGEELTGTWAKEIFGEVTYGENKMIACPSPQSDRNPAWVLACIGESAIESLMPYVRDTEKTIWEARVGAAEALGWMGPVAVEPLLAELEHERLEVRIRASAALIQIGNETNYSRIMESLIPGNRASADKNTLIDEFILLLDHEEALVRGNAAWALGYLGVERSVEPLIAYLERVEGWDIWLASKSLGILGDVCALEPLLAK